MLLVKYLDGRLCRSELGRREIGADATSHSVSAMLCRELGLLSVRLCKELWRLTERLPARLTGGLVAITRGIGMPVGTRWCTEYVRRGGRNGGGEPLVRTLLVPKDCVYDRFFDMSGMDAGLRGGKKGGGVFFVLDCWDMASDPPEELIVGVILQKRFLEP